MSDLEAAFLSRFGALFPRPEWTGSRLGAVMSGLRLRKLEAGETLLREGQSCSALPFVLEGRLRVFKVAESGREISLYRIGPGETCVLSSGCMTGSAAVEEGSGSALEAFPASVVAEVETSAAFMPAGLVRRLLGENGAFRDFILSQFSARMAGVMELVEEVAFRRVDERLAERLRGNPGGRGRDGARHQGGQAGVPVVRATHQVLAEEVGTSREVVSRILKDWEDRGFVRLARGEIRLLPPFFSME